MMLLCTEGRIFSWGNSSRGRLGREASNDDCGDCPSLVTVSAAHDDDDDDDDDGDDAGGASRDVRVTSLCCSHSISLICLTQRNVTQLLLHCYQCTYRFVAGVEADPGEKRFLTLDEIILHLIVDDWLAVDVDI